jgi:hypothetical protein
MQTARFPPALKIAPLSAAVAVYIGLIPAFLRAANGRASREPQRAEKESGATPSWLLASAGKSRAAECAG